eukprot:scaffold442_cov268-Pinguiococcus_pyrenoidosus.AAC.117
MVLNDFKLADLGNRCCWRAGCVCENLPRGSPHLRLGEKHLQRLSVGVEVELVLARRTGEVLLQERLIPALMDSSEPAPAATRT